MREPLACRSTSAIKTHQRVGVCVSALLRISAPNLHRVPFQTQSLRAPAWVGLSWRVTGRTLNGSRKRAIGDTPCALITHDPLTLKTLNSLIIRRIRAPIKIKSALPPPPKTPPQKGEFYGHGFSCRKNAFFQVSIKLAHPFPAPELRTRILRTRGFFWN